MKKTMLVLATVASLAGAGCTTAEQGAVVGGLGGAAVGQLAGGDTKSTLIGAGAGAIGGYLIGRAIDDRPGYCQQYDRRTGRPYGRPYQC